MYANCLAMVIVKTHIVLPLCVICAGGICPKRLLSTLEHKGGEKMFHPCCFFILNPLSLSLSLSLSPSLLSPTLLLPPSLSLPPFPSLPSPLPSAPSSSSTPQESIKFWTTKEELVLCRTVRRESFQSQKTISFQFLWDGIGKRLHSPGSRI